MNTDILTASTVCNSELQSWFDYFNGKRTALREVYAITTRRSTVRDGIDTLMGKVVRELECLQARADALGVVLK